MPAHWFHNLIKSPIAVGLSLWARCLLALFFALAASSLSAQTVYGVGSTNLACTAGTLNSVFTVNSTTGAATSVGTLSFNSAANAFNSNNGLVYYIEQNVANPRLATWNPVGGANTILGTTSLPITIIRMAISPDGRLYAASNDVGGTSGIIYEINATTGATLRTITTTNLPIGGSGDFAFADNGDLYVVANDTVVGNPYQLWRIPAAQISTLTSVTAITIGANLGIANTIAPNGLARIAPTGTCASLCFAMTTGATNVTYLVNGSTGAATPLGGTGTTGACLTDLGSGYTADVSITKTDGSTTYTPGAAITYTIVASNAGPAYVTGAVITDTVPAAITGVTWACAASGTATCGAASGAGNAISTTANIPAGATNFVTYTVKGTVNPTATGNLVNTATIAAPGTIDPTPANNTATDTDTVLPIAELVISKSDAVAAVNANGSNTYTIRVTNNGPSTATGAILKDALATGLNKTAVACSATPGQCATAPTATQLESVGGFALPVLSTGQFYEITVTATVTATSGSVTNIATVAPPAGFTNPGTSCTSPKVYTAVTGVCSVSDTDTVTPIANLAITKTDGVSSVNAGGNSTYTIRVTNNGPSSVTGANLLDPAVTNLTMGTPACSATPGQCVTAPTLVSLQTGGVTLPTLASGQFYEITVSGAVAGAATGNITNAATVTPPSGTTNPGTSCIAPMVYAVATGACTSTDSNTVNSIADMSPVISGLPTVAAPGASVTGTIVCTNAGPAAATTATCTTTGNNGATVTPGACVASAGSAASLPAGATLTCAITVVMPGSLGGGDTTPIDVSVTGTTGATNDSNGGTGATGNNSTAALIGIIDALNDAASTPFGTASSLNVLTNDTVGLPGATLTNTTITVVSPATPGATFDPSTGNFSVPATAVPGTYTVTYQICATPAVTPAACDQATATIVVGAASSVSGTVFHDVNGATNSLVDGTGTNASSASLTVYLVGGSGNVVGSNVVTANGIYTIANVLNGTYGVVLSNTAGVANGSAAPAPSVPAGWVNTGEGLTPAGEPAAQVNGSIANVVVSNASVTGANFGIEQPPTAQNNTNVTQANPGGTSPVLVASSSFTTGASDTAPGTITGYLIPAFPTGADSITINGATYTAATFPVGGVTVPVVNIGTIAVDPAGSGTGPATVTIPFRPVDNANVLSTATYTATVPLAAPVADLAIQKNGPASVTAGGPITYTLTVSNAGTYSVNNVTVRDNVPNQVTGLTVICGAANGGADCGPAANYSFSGNALSASVASLPSGGSVVLTVTGTVAADTSASFTNTATVVVPAGVTDPNPANNTSSVTSGVGIVFTQADLSIIKTGTSTVQVGRAISYIIKVTNAGPAKADGAVVGDVVPAAITGVTTTCVASGGAVCPSSIAPGNSINLAIPTLPSASSIELQVNGIAPAAAQSLINSATIAAPAGITDPLPANNSSAANTTVTAVPPTIADLAIVKTGPATVASGDSISYTVTVVNNGPGSANGAIFADPLPSVLTNAKAICTAINGATCGTVVVSGANVTSVISTLPAGGVVTFNITATAPASGSFSNIATITPPPGVNDPNTTNNASGAVITQIQNTGIAGVVWRDVNRNSTRDPGEPLLSGVTVLVRNSAGAVVGTAQTNAQGAYNIVGLVPGTGYTVAFDFGNLDRGLVIPQNTNASLNGTATNQTTISNVTLAAGVVTLDQNARVVDPGGVIYDSVTRTPIAGATVTLFGPNGLPVPASQLLVTTPNNQVTLATGSYEFLLNGTAPAGTYTLQITPPAGYGPPNAVNGGVAQPTAVSVPPLPGTLLVQPQATPPAVGASTTYHFVLNNLGPGAQDVLNNHIPLDRQVAGNLLINKIAATNVAEVGDSVKYTIRINNTNNFILNGAVVRDTAPAGFRYIADTAKVAAVKIANPSGAAPTLSFALPPLAPNSTTELTYFMRLGVGSQQSDGVNRAQLFGSTGQILSNLAAAKVRVTGGVLGADACIIGKVFVDCIGAVEGGNVLSSSASGDQVQRNVGGSNELGVPGVRIVMETGAFAVTDSEGKYSICPVTPSTHVLRVDKRTLPKGSRMLPQSNRNAGDGTSLFADVKNGELHRADFMEGSCSTEVVDQIKARRAQGNVNAPETERPDATQFRNQNTPQPFLPKPQQILPEPRQSDAVPATKEGN